MALILSTRVTVATAGTAQQMPSNASFTGGLSVLGNVYIKSPAVNTGQIYLGNDGADDVAVTNGFILDPGDGIQLNTSTIPLELYYIDAEVSGEYVTLLRVG